jgi:hypothetical protein
MFLQDLGQFFGEWDGAFFPIFRQKRILRFCPDVDSPMGEVGSGQWSVWSSPRRRPIASTKEQNARSQSSHLAKKSLEFLPPAPRLEFHPRRREAACVLTPFNKEATARRPLDAFLAISL